MKKKKLNPKVESTKEILQRLAKRIEEATVDIHEMRTDLKFVKLRLGNVEKDTKIMKVDIEKMRDVLGEVKKDTDSLIETTSDILTNMVTQGEFKHLSKRVTSLENQ